MVYQSAQAKRPVNGCEVIEPSRMRGSDREGELVEDDRLADRRLQGRPVLVQLGPDDGRHPARRHHRRPAGPGRRQRRGDPAAADLHHAADLGDHHALLHLLGSAVRRRHHLDPVQYPGRALVGGDHLRRPSHGPAGPRRRGADGGLHLLLRRRAGGRDPDHLPGAADRQVRAAVRAGRVLLRLLPDLRQLRRHGPGLALQGAGLDVPGLRAGLRSASTR